MSADPSRAVFLSYASQDADVAHRLADALRAGAVEVWLDRSELAGGEAWDRNIWTDLAVRADRRACRGQLSLPMEARRQADAPARRRALSVAHCPSRCRVWYRARAGQLPRGVLDAPFANGLVPCVRSARGAPAPGHARQFASDVARKGRGGGTGRGPLGSADENRHAAGASYTAGRPRRPAHRGQRAARRPRDAASDLIRPGWNRKNATRAQSGAGVAERFTFVGLATVTDPTLIAASFARALQFRELTGPDALSGLKRVAGEV